MNHIHEYSRQPSAGLYDIFDMTLTVELTAISGARQLKLREYISSHFPNRWIGRFGPDTWPSEVTGSQAP